MVFASSIEALKPVYTAISEGVLPGLAKPAQEIISLAPDDYSDYSFIHQATCIYLQWAVHLNRWIRDSSDSQKPNGDFVSNDEGYFDLSIANNYCSDLSSGFSQVSLHISFTPASCKYQHYFPVQSFVEKMNGAFSPVASFVQFMPSYEEISIDPENNEPSLLMRQRVMIELILYTLGRISKGNVKTRWPIKFKELLMETTQQFHCSRFLKKKDDARFSDCINQSTSEDTQRSNHAVKLKDIALGAFTLPSLDGNRFYDYSYGYQPGLVVAAPLNTPLPGNMSKWLRASPVAESLVILLLMRKGLIAH